MTKNEQIRTHIQTIKASIASIEMLLGDEVVMPVVENGRIEYLPIDAGSGEWNMKNIRDLLVSGFSGEELRLFVFDTPEFRPVDSNLASLSGKDKIIYELISFAERYDLFEHLLGWAKAVNPNKYQKWGPYKVNKGEM